MAAKWNEVVQREDEVIVVGDLALGKIDDSLEWASKLNGKKFLIPGNHDRCWRGNGKWAQWEAAYEAAGFTILPSSIHIEIAGQEVEVCHFPFAGNENPNRSRPDKFSGNRPDDVGQLLIHGHVHDAWTTKGRMMNVGVDVWDFYPVAEDWVADWVTKQTALAS